jgi:deoxyribonuclease-4
MYGLHIDSSPNIICDELIKYKDLKCIQLFVNINSKYKSIYKDFKNIAEQNKQNIIVHLSYTINIAQNWTEYSWWITQLLIELEIAESIGAKYAVLHLGKSIDIDLKIALNNMYSSLLYIASKLRKNSNSENNNIKILLETSSGQGSEMCITLDELGNFINKLLKNKNKNISNRFGICVDTCHIFNAGYDLNTSSDVANYLKEFDNKIGLKNIKLFHLNNSKTLLGSKIDRHDNLERGKIKTEGLIEIIKFAKKLEIPLILETPDEYIQEDIKLIKNNYKL